MADNLAPKPPVTYKALEVKNLLLDMIEIPDGIEPLDKPFRTVKYDSSALTKGNLERFSYLQNKSKSVLDSYSHVWKGITQGRNQDKAKP